MAKRVRKTSRKSTKKAKGQTVFHDIGQDKKKKTPEKEVIIEESYFDEY